MAAWADFERENPELAAAGRRLLLHDGVAWGFLSTVRADGGPRVHPVCPVIAEGGLWLFIVAMSPKLADLERDARFALHALVTPELGEEFYVAGTARRIDDLGAKQRIVDATGGRQGAHDFEILFELQLEHALHTRWANWGTAETWPSYVKWHA